MRPIPPKNDVLRDGLNEFLVYVQRYDFIPQSGVANVPDKAMGMYALRRAIHSDGITRHGGVVPVKYFHTPLMLVVRYGLKADPRLRMENLMEKSDEFWLNDFCNKDTFFSMRSN